MITPMQMYWLLKLDDINVAFSVAVVLSILVLMVSTVILCASFKAGDIKIYKPARISVLVSLLSAILFSCAVTFLPTTKQMAAIYYEAYCFHCGFVGPECNSKEEAIDAWNRREK